MTNPNEIWVSDEEKQQAYADPVGWYKKRFPIGGLVAYHATGCARIGVVAEHNFSVYKKRPDFYGASLLPVKGHIIIESLGCGPVTKLLNFEQAVPLPPHLFGLYADLMGFSAHEKTRLAMKIAESLRGDVKDTK